MDEKNTNTSIATAPTQAAGTSGTDLASIGTVKLSSFWKESPENWFYIVEATFAIARITADESKFRHALVNLDYTVLPYIFDLLSDPPPQGKYDALKKTNN